MAVAIDPGTGILAGFNGQQISIAAGSSAVVGPYQLRVLTVDGDSVRFELSNPDS